MEIKQQLRLSQNIVMTPQLQQAIKLLQMSRMELVELVQEELLENPVLEDGMDGHDEREVAMEDAPTIDKQIASDDKAATDQENKEQKDDIDWERYLENHALQQPLPSVRRGPDEEMPGVDQTLTRGDDLVDHLAWQLRMGDFIDEEQKFGALVLGQLNETGMLVMDDVPVDEIVPRFAVESGLHPEDAEEVLSMMQRFDPVGCCTRSLEECLLVQADHFGMDELTKRVLREHLKDLERRNYNNIAKALAIEIEEVYDIAQVITELEPRPGRNFASAEPRYITPDVYVHKVGEEYFVMANDDGMPKLKISGFYRAAMADDPKAKEYIKGKLRSAQWLIRSIDQRRKTIIKVTECIVEKQREFFDKGIEYLKPMILRDVAESVGLHESTISRVTSNKYVNTPRGLLELKFFFNSAIRRDNQDDIASESVKQAIKKIVDAEDSKSPYSDQKLVKMLAESDIKIARRTVAKYREMLGILSSTKRKKYF